MWHKIENIAETRFLNPVTFKKYVLEECPNDCTDGFIHGKDVNIVVANYRAAGFKERLVPKK